MENSIIFVHPEDYITASNEGKLYKKVGDDWSLIDSTLYKSELNYPSSEIGNNDDYYVKYARKYNHLLYSENFSAKVWNNFGFILNTEDSVKFPKTSSTKLIPNASANTHSLSYIFTNDEGKYYTFSVYVKPNELKNIQISLEDSNNTYGVKLDANLSEKTTSYTMFGDTSTIVYYGSNIEEIVKTYTDRSTFNYFRIWLTVKFNDEFKCSANIRINETPDNNSDGLFINAAQLALNTIPEDYAATTDTYITSLYLEQLYQKVDGEWVNYDHNLYYYDDKDLGDDGEEGDIATLMSIIKINPALIVGRGTCYNVWKRPVGTIRYSQLKQKYYVQTRPGFEYSLEYEKPAPDYNRASMAMTLNQQSYQTFTRFCEPNTTTKYSVNHKVPSFEFKPGINCGGCYNDWSRYHIVRH